ncbi:MAG: TonB family protein [Bryobacterales bacterium]|nr:TonB family protein [Bryobacterales bacterium]
MSLIPEPEEVRLDLLLTRDTVWDSYRHKVAAIGSIAVHVMLTLVALSVKESPYVPRSSQRLFVRHVTPLYVPPELTQKAPNNAPVSKELTVESIAPRPTLKAPSPAPAAARPQLAKVAPPMPAPVTPKEAPKQVVIEAPKIESPVQGLQTAQLPKSNLPNPEAEKPKIAFENVGAGTAAPGTGSGRGTGLIQVPSSSIQEAVRSLSRSQGNVGSISIGDIGSEEGGLGPGLNLPPSAGRPRSNLELKSDPMGVDFRPYMTQVLAAVRRSWFAVYPEAARLGQRGQVVLQFAIARQGSVTKVIFSGQSGAKALDQSAVAAISASNPLPPLPTEFKGDRIVLQMTFLYNMPR